MPADIEIESEPPEFARRYPSVSFPYDRETETL
jgi:hypothetical protein